MSIRINQSKTYKTQVNFTTLDANGKKENQSFQAEFQRYTTEEFRVLQESGKNDREILSEVLVGWKVDGGAEGDLPFTPENVDKLCNDIAGFAGVTVLRFIETVGASREKN